MCSGYVHGFSGISAGSWGISGAFQGELWDFRCSQGSLRGIQGFSKAFKGSSGGFRVALRALQGSLIGVSGASGLGWPTLISETTISRNAKSYLLNQLFWTPRSNVLKFGPDQSSLRGAQQLLGVSGSVRRYQGVSKGLTEAIQCVSGGNMGLWSVSGV